MFPGTAGGAGMFSQVCSTASTITITITSTDTVVTSTTSVPSSGSTSTAGYFCNCWILLLYTSSGYFS